MMTLAVGNSISAQSQYGFAGASSWQYRSELQWANTLTGAPMRFAEMTPTTRSDRNGVYGYSGQELGTINADIAAQWIAQATGASVTPELVVGLSLLENDVANGIAVATMQTRLQTWISTVRAQWPSVKLLICTPRPSFSNNTGPLVANYQAIRDYILGLDNGSDIFVSRLDAYENGASPGTPLAGYTDASVHPNAKGALVNARTIAATLRRLGARRTPINPQGANLTLTGSIAATGTGVTGTMPTAGSFNFVTNVTTVSVANNPGWSIAFTPLSAATSPNDAQCTHASNSVAGAVQVSPYAVVRIVSGAANLRGLGLEPRINDGSGNNFRNYLQLNGTDVDVDFIDGDVLTLVMPPRPAASGSLAAVQNYFRATFKATTSPATFQVIQSGVIVVT
jgi:lysophospholipase L1-like esterase